MEGRHEYNISPNGKFAIHDFNNSNTPPARELISLPDHKPISSESIQAMVREMNAPKLVEFFKVKTDEGIEMDGWMVKPKNFDPTKKYPVLFSVYAEPGGQTVT